MLNENNESIPKEQALSSFGEVTQSGGSFHKNSMSWDEKNAVLQDLDPNSKLYVAALRKYFSQTAQSGVNSNSRKVPWLMSARNQELRVNQVNVFYNPKRHDYIYGIEANIRRDVNPNASYAGAPVSAHRLKDGSMNYMQFVTQPTMNKILEVNGQAPYTQADLSHALSTKTPLATSRDALVFNGNIGSKTDLSNYQRRGDRKRMEYFFNPNPSTISKSQYYYDNRYELHLEQESRNRKFEARQQLRNNAYSNVNDRELG